MFSCSSMRVSAFFASLDVGALLSSFGVVRALEKRPVDFSKVFVSFLQLKAFELHPLVVSNNYLTHNRLSEQILSPWEKMNLGAMIIKC